MASLGADESESVACSTLFRANISAAFDYKDPEVADKIKQWAGSEGISKALDCISEKGESDRQTGDLYSQSRVGSTKLAADSMSGGEVVTLRRCLCVHDMCNC